MASQNPPFGSPAWRAKYQGKSKSKNFIAGAIKKPGALHADLGVPQGQTIPKDKIAAAAKAGGKTGQRARFAEVLAGMSHGKGKQHRAKKVAKKVARSRKAKEDEAPAEAMAMAPPEHVPGA